MMLHWIVVLSCLISASSAFVFNPTAVRAASMASQRDTSLAMGLTLYGSPGSRSPLVDWALYELGLDFEMGDLAENPHPFGQIPCLTDDNDVIVFESGAILIYLNSKASTELDKAQKAQILSWVAWANASLDPICFLETPDGKVYDTGLKKPNRRIDKLNSILENKGDFLVGDNFTVADIAISSYLLYVVQFFPDIDLSRWSHIVTYMKVCVSRPAYAKAFGERIQQFLTQALNDMGKPRGVFDIF